MVKVPLPLNASTNRYHKTQAPNATTNGGDASRVGHQGKDSQTGMQLVLSFCVYYMSPCFNARRGTRRSPIRGSVL